MRREGGIAKCSLALAKVDRSLHEREEKDVDLSFTWQLQYSPSTPKATTSIPKSGRGQEGGFKGFLGPPPKPGLFYFILPEGGRKKVVLRKLFIKKGPWVGVSAGKGRRS